MALSVEANSGLALIICRDKNGLLISLKPYQTNTAQNLIVSERPPILYAMPARRSLIGRRSDAAAVLVAVLT